MITNFFIPELNNHDVQKLWFQQDGATCHTARATIEVLKDTFSDRLISRFGPVNWPPRSSNLTTLDSFLWGYVKSLVYANKPQTLDHLEDNIRRVIADIRPQMLEKVIENWTSRLDYIRASRGSPMPEIIFKIWPPKSCDLTPEDYFLWGYVKSLVYADKPQTLDHLEDNIRRVIADIRPQMLEKVIENWTSRLDYIRASRDSPMPEIIFKMLNYQTDVQIFCQCVWDNHKSAPAVIGNCSLDLGSKCLSGVFRVQKGWLHSFPWPSDQHTTVTFTKAEPAFIRPHNTSPIHPRMSFGLASGVSNSNGLESKEYRLQGVWLGAVLEVPDFYHFIVSLWYQMQF
ncbi:DUF4817 domain-containing protein [Trichonephila clavipes]|nr:DUF4817 domain-containing protein [Trichonephila clavipes]